MQAGSNPTAPLVSVVICTRNREHQIERAVSSVLANEYPNFDLTVIDQSTDDGTRQALAHLIESDPRLRYVHSSEAGLSRAYNTGIASTTGEILAFTDDDCVAWPDWITKVVAAFDAEPDAELLYGEVVAFGETADDVALTPALVYDGPRRLSKREGVKVIGMGANYAARRSVFQRVGPFDQVLGGGGPLRSAQDYDMMYRVQQAGGVVLLRPEVSMRHDGRREAVDWPALNVAYGTGDGAFYTKHIRCRDLRAVRLAGSHFGRMAIRWIAKTVLRRDADEGFYVKGFIAGIRGSFGFEVDRAKRLYVEK